MQVAVVPTIGAYGSRETLLVQLPSRGRDFLRTEMEERENLERTAIRLLLSLGAVSLAKDDEYKFERLGFIAGYESDHAVPIISWLTISSLTEQDIAEIVGRNNRVGEGMGKVVRCRVDAVGSELWQDPDDRRRTALYDIWTRTHNDLKGAQSLASLIKE